jgi:peptidyl-dipeptidase Dcp
MLPRLAAHRDTIDLDPRVFARIADLAARRDALGLGAGQTAALDRYHRDVVRAGAMLPRGREARPREINERLSVLDATFRANLSSRDASPPWSRRSSGAGCGNADLATRTMRHADPPLRRRP